VVGPLLYDKTESPGYARGLRSNLALFCLLILLVATTSAYIAYLNKRHAEKRVSMGKSAVIVDTSLESAKVAATMQDATHGTGVVGDGTGADAVGEHAFEDMTDLENEEFIFVF
jgi:hypothetical protein